MEKSYIVTVELDDNGDAILPLPDEVVEYLGWKTGDTIDWAVDEKGGIAMTKVDAEETEYVMVETVSTFRNRYVVEVPKGKKEYALDSVTCDEAAEFSQKHIGEQIVTHRVLEMTEALEIFDEDNAYLLQWSDQQKIDTFLTKWDSK